MQSLTVVVRRCSCLTCLHVVIETHCAHMRGLLPPPRVHSLDPDVGPKQPRVKGSAKTASGQAGPGRGGGGRGDSHVPRITEPKPSS